MSHDATSATSDAKTHDRAVPPGGQSPAAAIAYDAYVFFTFLLCLLVIYTVGMLLRLVDRVFGTRLLDPLIRLFELIGGR